MFGAKWLDPEAIRGKSVNCKNASSSGEHNYIFNRNIFDLKTLLQKRVHVGLYVFWNKALFFA